MCSDSFPAKGPVFTQLVGVDPSPPKDSRVGDFRSEPLDAGLSSVQSQYGCVPV